MASERIAATGITKRWWAAIAVALMTAALLTAFGSGTASAAETCGGFPDVSASNVQCDEIAWLAEHGITQGDESGNFNPSGDVTRGQMAAFIYRMQTGNETAPACTEKPFDDVEVDGTFCGAIAWLETQGISKGYDDGTYRPNEVVRRGEMAAFLYRISNTTAAPACTEKPFDDVAVDSTFCGVIAWAKANGITLGTGNGNTFGLGDSVERQDMAAFVHRTSDYIAENPTCTPTTYVPCP